VFHVLWGSFHSGENVSFLLVLSYAGVRVICLSDVINNFSFPVGVFCYKYMLCWVNCTVCFWW